MVRNGDADLHFFGIYKARWPVVSNVSDYPSMQLNLDNYSWHFRHDYMAKMMNINMQLFREGQEHGEHQKHCVSGVPHEGGDGGVCWGGGNMPDTTNVMHQSPEMLNQRRSLCLWC